ncbi:MAG: hypothetical protein K2K55_01120 [Duncaniella sp.]|nr:hypothetical protein [Duncaniella sp.]
MKSKNTKAPMIISAAAAARLFLKIASMELDPIEKCQLMTLLSEIIDGRRDIDNACFPTACEEIRSDLTKAISRSAKARAAAARRRASAKDNETDNSSTNEKNADPKGVYLPVALPQTVSVLPDRDDIVSTAPVTAPQKRKRRNRRRRRNRRTMSVIVYEPLN